MSSGPVGLLVRRHVCTAADEGARLERLLRDHFRAPTGGGADAAAAVAAAAAHGGRPAEKPGGGGSGSHKPLTNRQLRDAIGRGEVLLNASVVYDKARVLHEGDVCELRHDAGRAASAARSKTLDVAYRDSDVAVVWKRAGLNCRDVEQALRGAMSGWHAGEHDGKSSDGDRGDSTASSSSPSSPRHVVELLYRISKGVSGLLVAPLSAVGAVALASSGGGGGGGSGGAGEMGRGVRLRFRLLVYGKVDTEGGEVLATEVLPHRRPLGQPELGQSRTSMPREVQSGGDAGDANDDDDGDNDEGDDDEDEEGGAGLENTEGAASGGAARCWHRRNQDEDTLLWGGMRLRTAALSRSSSAGWLSTLDMWCVGFGSGGRHKRALCRCFAAAGHPLVGDESAQHAWVKKKGLHLALVRHAGGGACSSDGVGGGSRIVLTLIILIMII